MHSAMITVFLLLTAGQTTAEQTPDYPIVPVPATHVRPADPFWAPRMETNRKVTVWYDFQKCEETGRIDNFAVAGGLQEGGFQGIYFNDSDVVKVVEGAAYSLALKADPKLDEYLDGLIAKIAAAQEDDGYLYTARTIGDPNYNYPGREARWSHLAHGHELYNVGHMYEAAVAHHEATGKRTLLDVAVKNADLVCRVFGPGEGQRVDVPGHEEIEIGLVRLYRATGERKYLDQAKFFIDMRGRADLRKTYGPYCQDHVPVVEQSHAVGHAVRAGYLYAGIADVAALTGNKQYIAAIDRIWHDVVDGKQYLTGGVGASRGGEAFGKSYELPNKTAYNETCAAIANALWNHRMFLLHGDAKYVDVLERVIYNGFVVGVSLEGNTFFYPCPLSADGNYGFNHGSCERSPWFGCSCCPVNVVRFVPSIAGYVYAVRDDAAYVNLYMAGQGDVELAGGELKLTQQTDYPWNGDVEITVEPEQPAEATLKLRIPGWAQGRPFPSDLYRYVDAQSPPISLKVNGQPQPLLLDRGYATIRRTWNTGDTVELNLPMPVCRVLAHPEVKADAGRVAVERGPIVYCAEAVDNGGKTSNLLLLDDAELSPEHRPELLGGVTVLRGAAAAVHRGEEGDLQQRSAELTLVPYCVWNHRGVGEMDVWLAREAGVARPAPRPTVASQARVSASHRWGPDSTAALNDQVEPRSSDDHDVARFTWWDHRGTTEWVQYDLAQPTEVSGVDVYWFDDTGRGQCRVPASWKLLWRDGEQWKPVAAEGLLPVRRDQFNTIEFDPVTTTALRIEVQLQDEYSGGILEWRVTPTK